MTGRYEQKFKEINQVLCEGTHIKRYRKIGPLLLDVYVQAYFPQNEFRLSWNNAPDPGSVKSNLGNWYFQLPNQQYAHFKEAKQYMLGHLAANLENSFPDISDKQKEHVVVEAQKFFFVDSSERFNALLLHAAYQKKALRAYFSGVCEGISQLNPKVVRKWGEDYFVN